MEDALELYESYGMEIDELIVSSIMRCYRVAREDIKALECLEKHVSNGGALDKFLLHQKCVSLSAIIINDIENVYDFKLKKELYDDIVDTVHRQLELHGVAKTPTMIMTQLNAAIALYKRVDPMDAVLVFQDLAIQQQLIDLKYRDWNKGENMMAVDLHSFDRNCAQFILRYVIGYELNYWLENADKLLLVVGYGKHSHAQKGGKLKQFVIRDLLNYDPPIRAKETRNGGCLRIDKRELLRYLNNDMNHAKHRLTYPSDDWYLEDPRRNRQD